MNLRRNQDDLELRGNDGDFGDMGGSVSLSAEIRWKSQKIRQEVKSPDE
jgi:hypothetical protein